MKSTTWRRLAEQAIFFPSWGERPTFFFFHYYSFVFNLHFFRMKQFLKKIWLYFKFPRINSLPLPIAQWDTGLYLYLQDHTVLVLSCFSSNKSRINKAVCRFLGSHQVVLSLCLLLKWILQIIDLSLLWELWELFVICMS